MTTISDSSSVSIAHAFEAIQRPEVDAQEIMSPDDGRMTDCFPTDPPIFDDLEPPMLEPCDREPYLTEDGTIGYRTVVTGTSGDDSMEVTRNRDGSVDVTINGETKHYSPEEAKNMRISGGAGNDTITVTDNRSLLCWPGSGDLTVEGSSGDDNISGDLGGADVDGGTGNDTIDGWPEFDLKVEPGNIQGQDNQTLPYYVDLREGSRGDVNAGPASGDSKDSPV